MAQKNFAIKNGLTVAGTERISSSGDITGSHFGTFSGTSTTRAAGTNNTQLATTAFVTGAISDLVDSAPGTLNTLNELAAALNDDASFSTTITNSIATKLPLAGGTLTGNLDIKGGGTALGVYRTLAIASDTQSEIVLGSQDLSNNYVDAVKIRGLLKANKTTGQLSFYTLASGSLTEAMRIDELQRVGIGTQSPGVAGLDVYKAGGWGQIRADGTAGGEIIWAKNQTMYGNIYASDTHGLVINAANGLADIILSSGGNAKMVINDTGRVDIGKASFSGYPVGSTFNVYGDGESIRLDGSSGTTRRLRFRNVGAGSGVGEIVADGSLKIYNEDVGSYLHLSSIRNIEYQTTSTNSSAGDHIFSSYNTTIMRLDGANNRVGIGTDSPDTKLDIEHTASSHLQGIHITNMQPGGYGSAIRFNSRRSDSGQALEEAAQMRVVGTNSWNASGTVASKLVFATAHNNTITDRMEIDNNGNIKSSSGGMVLQTQQHYASTAISTTGSYVTVLTMTIDVLQNSKLAIWVNSGQILNGGSSNSNPTMLIRVDGAQVNSHNLNHYWYNVTRGSSGRLWLTTQGVSGTLAAGTRTITIVGGHYGSGSSTFNYQSQGCHVIVQEIGAN